MFPIKPLILSAFILTSLLSKAQEGYQIDVHFSSGNVITYTLTDVGSIANGDGARMDVCLADGGTKSYKFSAIDSVVFVQTNGYINGYEYVDLGLSVKWATVNVGASSPEDYGDYFAWGEMEAKETYSGSNSAMLGVETDDITGDGDYDAATANWGSPWRMPTYTECKELMNRCTWTWTTLEGVNGYLVTGPRGYSIFLPAAGCREEESLIGAGTLGDYWLSTPNINNASSSYDLNFYSDSHYMNWLYRHYGRTVRPVSD